MSEQDVAAGGTAGTVRNGGFWIRVLAYIIDSIILWIVYFVVMLIFGFNMEAMMMQDADAAEAIGSTIGFTTMLIWLLYSVGFISSKLQATPGKLVVGVKVTDDEGQRVSILRALGRELSKIISGLILMIGFIMVAFTDRKRGLHDMIAGTLVSYRR
ncbi:MAG: RDD family protein [Alphaproteobacteria bacterium]|jgi:uncharacterized RDD family membrane protein YckC|nr:RDD family protein [Alphaproteobacteria bacterium]